MSSIHRSLPYPLVQEPTWCSSKVITSFQPCSCVVEALSHMGGQTYTGRGFSSVSPSPWGLWVVLWVVYLRSSLFLIWLMSTGFAAASAALRSSSMRCQRMMGSIPGLRFLAFCSNWASLDVQAKRDGEKTLLWGNTHQLWQPWLPNLALKSDTLIPEIIVTK